MQEESSRQAWAMGGTIFAATAMIVLGAFQMIVGIAAMAQDELFVAGSDYVYSVDVTAWGWIHLILGIVMLLTGIGLYTGAMWARMLGIGLAVISAVANFFFLPYYPLWSMAIIAVDIFVIWSLATVHSRSGRHSQETAGGMGGGRRPQEDWSQVNAPTTTRESNPSMNPGTTAADVEQQPTRHRRG